MLESETTCKVVWGSKQILEGLLYQDHPREIKANIRTLVDAQKALLPDEREVSLSEAIEGLVHQRQPSLKKRQQQQISDADMGNMDFADWTLEEWQQLQFLLKPPDWDRFHAENERVFRRPFSQKILKHGAAEVIALEASRGFLAVLSWDS